MFYEIPTGENFLLTPVRCAQIVRIVYTYMVWSDANPIRSGPDSAAHFALAAPCHTFIPLRRRETQT